MTNPTCDCGRPTSGAWLCAGCQRTLRWAFVNVATYWVDLGTVERKETRYGSSGYSKGSIGEAQPLPVDMRFVSGPAHAARHGAQMAPGSKLRWDAWDTVVAWTRTVMAEQPPMEGPTCATCAHPTCRQIHARRWPEQPRTTTFIAYLTRQFDYIVRSTWAPQLLDEFLNLEQRLKRMIDRPADRWYAGKCRARYLVIDGEKISELDCDAELYATTDTGTIKCRVCETVHDVAGRREVLLDEAKDQLVTATEAASALIAWTDYDGPEHKLVDRIRKWRDRDHLDVADVTSLHGRDRHLYRLGDVQALLIEHAQRRQQRRIGA